MASANPLTLSVNVRSDQRGACCNADDPDNPSNCVTVPFLTPSQALVREIAFGTVEMPLPQYLIERTWSKLRFSEGIALVVDEPADEPIRELSIEVDGVVYRGVLPLWLNPVIDVDVATPDSPIFTTLYEHALEIRSSWNWGQPITLISTALGDDPSTALDAANTHLVILDEHRFQLRQVDTVTFTPPANGILGYLYAPLIPSPAHLADIVHAALEQVMPGWMEVGYDVGKAQFFLTWVKPSTQTCYRGALQVEPVTSLRLLIPAANSLATLMGFGYNTVPIPAPLVSALQGVAATCSSNSSSCAPNQTPSAASVTYGSSGSCAPSNPWCGTSTALCNACPAAGAPVPGLTFGGSACAAPFALCQWSLLGQFGWQCQAYLQVTPGNYLPEGLAAELNLQWRRFYLDPSAAPLSANRPVFVFSNQIGSTLSFPVEFGQYTATSLAAFLQDAMTTADPLGASYQVTYSAAAQQFSFRSNEPFGLEFNAAAQTFNPALLGFDALSYRGAQRYDSIHVVHAPVNECCVSGGSTAVTQTRAPRWIYTVRVNSNTQRFYVNVDKARTLTNLRVTALADGTGTALVEPEPATLRIAHGLALNDVVDVYLKVDQYWCKARVAGLVDAFSFLIDVGSDASLAAAANTLASATLNGLPAANLLLARETLRRQDSFLGRILGFPECDVLFRDSQGSTHRPFVSPYSYDFDPIPYVFLCLEQTRGSRKATAGVSSAGGGSQGTCFTTDLFKATGDQGSSAATTEIFAKLTLFPAYSKQLFIPMRMTFSPAARVEQVTVTFLTPWHQPYQFHGKNWSLTLVASLYDSAVSPVCK